MTTIDYIVATRYGISFPFVHRASASSRGTRRCALWSAPAARRADPPPTRSAPCAPAASPATTRAKRRAAGGASWGENSATWRSNLHLCPFIRYKW